MLYDGYYDATAKKQIEEADVTWVMKLDKWLLEFKIFVSMADALDTINVKGRTFRRWRIVAEARLVDEQAFNTLVGRIQNPTLDDCVAQGKTILQRSSSHAKLNSLFLAGACLKPMPKRN